MFQRHLKAPYDVTTSDSRNHNMAVCIAVIAKEVMIYRYFHPTGYLSISSYIRVYLIRLNYDLFLREIFFVQ